MRFTSNIDFLYVNGVYLWFGNWLCVYVLHLCDCVATLMCQGTRYPRLGQLLGPSVTTFISLLCCSINHPVYTFIAALFCFMTSTSHLITTFIVSLLCFSSFFCFSFLWTLTCTCLRRGLLDTVVRRGFVCDIWLWPNMCLLHSLLLHHSFQNLRSTQVAMVHCSAQTGPSHVLQKLGQTCMVLNTNTGRVYRPKDSERLILYLKDINLPKPDKWGTCQLIAFLQQVHKLLTGT